MTLETIAAIGDDPAVPGVPNMAARVRRPCRRAPLANGQLHHLTGHDPADAGNPIDLLVRQPEQVVIHADLLTEIGMNHISC
jgi:hypothetical protein